jgi:hypothetical protein
VKKNEPHTLFPTTVTKLSLYFFILAQVLYACEEQIESESGNTAPVRMVVDAMVTNQPGESYVKLSLPLANPNEAIKMVSGAIITISDGENYTTLSEEPSEKGVYKPKANLRGVTGKTYKIVIQTAGYKDSASSYLLPVSTLKEFKTYENASIPGHYYISGENGGNPSIIMYSVDSMTFAGNIGHPVNIYEYILGSFDVPQIFSPKKETISFPAGSRVIRKKYSLTPEYEAYIRSILSETEWRGGLFDVQPGNPQGNFGSSTFGYFAGCSMVTDTVYISNQN